MYIAEAVARRSGFVISAIDPPPIEREGEKVRPAKKRRMQRVQMFCEKPAPMVKIAPSGVETKYTTYLP